MANQEPAPWSFTPVLGRNLGHRRHCVAQPDALVEGGEHAEFHSPPQGGLAEE
jgi:hypothetical protein